MPRRKRKSRRDPAGALPHRRRRRELTPDERRREIVEVLAAGLAEMPAALTLPDGSAAIPSPDRPPEESSRMPPERT